MRCLGTRSLPLTMHSRALLGHTLRARAPSPHTCTHASAAPHRQGVEIEDLSAAVKRKTELYVELAGETTIIDCVFAIAKEAKARGE